MKRKEPEQKNENSPRYKKKTTPQKAESSHSSDWSKLEEDFYQVNHKRPKIVKTLSDKEISKFEPQTKKQFK